MPKLYFSLPNNVAQISSKNRTNLPEGVSLRVSLFSGFSAIAGLNAGSSWKMGAISINYAL
jgi:hypothetical protein